jgi:hypothetical protein
MKLTYEMVEFEKIPKRNVPDQYNVIEKKFGISEGLVIWNDNYQKYGYMPARRDWLNPNLLSEIIEFLKQLNDENKY